MFRKITTVSAARRISQHAVNRLPSAAPSSSLLTSSAWISCSVQRRHATTTASGGTNKNDDDDFVDIMFPGGADEDFAAPSSSTSSGATSSSSSLAATGGDDMEQLAVLGIQRDEPLADGEYRTRLGIRAKAGDLGTRMNTRSTALQGERNSSADLAIQNAHLLGEEDFDEDPEEGDLVEGEEGMDGEEGFTPDEDLKSIDLPYEDEKFAEAILQMEVEGQLDETWQMGAKAKREDCAAIIDILKHMKAKDLCCIDVSAKTSSFDYMIFATCEGPRHVHLCSWSVSNADQEKRLAKPKRKTSDRTWECVPVGRIIVNLMVESYRNEMSLERKWTVTKVMDPLDHANASVGEGRTAKAHGLWTLTLNLQDLEDFEVDYCKDALLAQL